MKRAEWGRSHGASLNPFWQLGKQPRKGPASIEFHIQRADIFDFVASVSGVCQVQISILMFCRNGQQWLHRFRANCITQSWDSTCLKVKTKTFVTAFFVHRIILNRWSPIEVQAFRGLGPSMGQSNSFG